jgi:hypothetical protein
MAKVNFTVVNKLSSYNGLAAKDANTLYFVIDAKRIYKGANDVTSNIEVVTAFDPAEPAAGTISLANAFEGKLYLNAATFEMRIKNGAAWSVLSPGYLTTGGNWAQADNDGKLGTIGVIKTIIGQAIAAAKPEVTFESSTGVLKVGDSSARLVGVINSVVYDPDQLQLVVKSISASGDPTSQTISLPKDNFVRSGRYEASYDLPEGGKGPAIVLVVNDGAGADKEVVIPAASLVDVYTGGKSDNIQVSVSDGNVITASAIIDPAEGNALVSSATGLKVDISGKANTVSAVSGNVIVANGDGNMKDGGVSILAEGEMGNSATKIPVASVIATAISSAVSAAQGTLQAAIDALGEKVTTLEQFKNSLAGKFLTASVVDNFVGFVDANGNIKDSGKKAGGATLAADPDASTLATEAAVFAAMSWQEI